MGHWFLFSGRVASNKIGELFSRVYSQFNRTVLNRHIGICSIWNFLSAPADVRIKCELLCLPSSRSCVISKAHHLHSAADHASVHSMLEEMPNRVRQSKNTHFDRVLGFLRTPTIGNKLTPLTAHCLALKIGALSHLPVSTYLLISYSRAGELNSSRDMFDEIPEKDVITWNAMITALVEQNCLDEALSLFLKMVELRGLNSTSLLIIVSALTSKDGLIQGRVVHGLGLKSGFLSDCSLCNALIDMYAKCDDLSSSECIFADMEFRDTFSWNSIVSGCLHSNDPVRCSQYFRERMLCEEKGDSISLSCAISAASSLVNLSWGQSLHAFASKIGLVNCPNNSVANSLVSFYSETGGTKAAEAIFGEMVHKDVVSWNALIEGYAKNGKFIEAFDLLHEMQLNVSSRPDKVTLLTTTSMCADESLLEEGRSVHGVILRRGMGSDTSLVNCLIDMYGKCGNIVKAELLFESIEERDLISWNTMICAYSQNGLYKAAQTLFKEMLRDVASCSVATILAILPSCNCRELLGFGKSLHSWQLKLGFSNNSLAVNSVMYMYINCGDLRTALSLLQRDSDMADTISWNTVIAACVQNGFFREALETFELMMGKSDAHVDAITLATVLSACGNLELVHGGKLIHGLYLKSLMGSDTHVQNALITMYGRCGDVNSARLVFSSGSDHNLCSWNCLISAYCQNNNAIEALELFDDLNLEPDEFTITGIITACTQLGAVSHGKQIHAYCFRHGFHQNSVICSALLDIYSNCGRLDFALQVFRKLDDKSITAWNSMISAYGYHSDGKTAIELFQQLIRLGTKPNSGTFTGLLSACSHSGLVKEGLWYYNHMKQDFGVEPLTEHSVCVVDMLGRSGQLLEAYEFIKQMKTSAVPGIWGALLSACSYHGNIQLGREVAEQLFKLDPENPGYYISMSNMYVAAGRWKDAVELRELIESKRLRKPAGYSLIDVGF